MKKKTFKAGMNVGSSSILVTFVLLCLVTFAALSFVSANADNRLAKQTAERVNNYYLADSAAERILANIAGQLNTIAKRSASEDAFYDGILDTFSDSDICTVTEDNGDIFISYEVPVSDIQNLSVTIRPVYPEAVDDSPFVISQWETYTVYTPEEPTLEEEKGNLLF